MPTEPPISNRVQIVPLGFEYERLRRPIEAWKADVVVAIEYAENEQPVPYVEAFLEELAEDDRVELDRRACDIFDLYDALGTITEGVLDYESDAVYVNLSAGSKITAIAGMIACMAAGASPIYARPDYGPDGERIPDEPLHDDVADVFELPTYPIERPSNLHLRFLKRIRAGSTGSAQGRYRGLPKKELIEFALDEAVPAFAQSETTSTKGYYRLLDRHVVEPLSEKGYVQIEQIGRRKFVALTTEGENAFRAFRHLVDAEETDRR